VLRWEFLSAMQRYNARACLSYLLRCVALPSYLLQCITAHPHLPTHTRTHTHTHTRTRSGAQRGAAFGENVAALGIELISHDKATRPRTLIPIVLVAMPRIDRLQRLRTMRDIYIQKEREREGQRKRTRSLPSSSFPCRELDRLQHLRTMRDKYINRERGRVRKSARANYSFSLCIHISLTTPQDVVGHLFPARK